MGLAEAQVYVGMYYDYGYHVWQDKATAFSYYLMAAQQGNVWGQCSVGTFYMTGTGILQDYSKAIAWLRRAAMNDNDTACYNLGTCYEGGKGTPVDKHTALQWYKRAADLGNHLGITHYNRLKRELDNSSGGDNRSSNRNQRMEEARRLNQQGMELEKKKNYTAAFKKYQHAAQLGLPEAMYNLGHLYQYGNGVTKDPAQAYFWINRSAENGVVTAICQLGTLHIRGIGTPVDYAKALECYRKAESLGHNMALNNLGYLYEAGLGVPQNKTLALEYYKRAMDQGVASAKDKYDRLKQELEPDNSDPMEKAKRLNKEGLELVKKKDHAGAFQKYLQAAQLGFPSGMHNVGACFQLGEGTQKDPEKAFYWINRGAAEDHTASIARLGWLYEEGIGTPVDMEKAIRLYEKAASRDNSLACNNLAVLYCIGKGILVDKEKAIELYEKAIRLGNTKAKDNLSRLKSRLNWPETEDLQKNPEEALAHFQHAWILDQENRFSEAFAFYLKSARMGNPDAMYNLGICYHFGEGTTQNYDLAVYWYRKAAALGKQNAWNNLGICYRNGYGVIKDKERALELYKTGADLGDEQAQQNYDNLYAQLHGQMPPTQTETLPPNQDFAQLSQVGDWDEPNDLTDPDAAIQDTQ